MSTITKEQAQKIIEAADEVITALAGTNEDVHPESDSMLRLWDDLNDRYAPPGVVRELARIAMASLEAEPVAYIGKTMLEDIVSGVRCCGRVWAGDEDRLSGESITPLYSSPQLPQPAVPECYQRLLHHAYGMTMGHDWNKGTMAGHHREKLCKAVEDCRAAMLQGTINHHEDNLDMVDHSGDANEKGNSPVIPDGFCIMPKKLTAENGGKGALSGEFHVTNRILCQSCGGEGCEDCNDEGGWDAEIPVSWDTIKRIHEAAVEACSLPAAPKPEA